MIKKINRKVLLLILVSSVFLTSCTSSYKAIYIETAKPSESILPNDIVSLTLMNRSMSDEFANYEPDSLQRYFYQKKFSVNTILLDSTVIDTTLQVLGELLFESGRYEVVIPEEHNIYRGLKFYKVPEELNWNYVQRVCDLYNTDALLVIERYYNKITTNYIAVGFTNSIDEVHEASIDSKYDAVIKIYDPSKQEVAKQMLISDTIYWYEDDISQSKLFEKLPKIKETLIQTGIQLALDIDSRLSPSWIREERVFFVLDSKSENIEEFINNGDWDSAYQYWEGFSKNSNKKTRAKAEFNLALACEMLGEIDQAIEWAQKSYYSQYRLLTENYLRKLGKRKETTQKFKELTN